MLEPIRVLHITGAMYPGGYENFIMNLYENMDRSKIQFDMVVHARKENDYVPRIEAMGGRVYELPRLTKHPVQNLVGLYRIVKRNHYPIVIRHTSNAMVTPQLLVSKLAGAYTICHSHNETDPNYYAHKLGRLLMNLSTCEKIACSEKAGNGCLETIVFILSETPSASKNSRLVKRKQTTFAGNLGLGHVVSMATSLTLLNPKIIASF